MTRPARSSSLTPSAVAPDSSGSLPPWWPDGISPEAFQAVLQDTVHGFSGRIPRRSPAEDVALPPPPDAPRMFVLRVDVDGARPPVWRRLRLRGDVTMDRMHHVLQGAFGWWDSHLHRFWLGPAKQLWTGPYLLSDWDVDEGEQGVHEADARLDQVVRDVGDRVFYTYDYGDEWNHTVKVEAIEDRGSDDAVATCIGGRRAGPMEDVGGVHAHNDIVASWPHGMPFEPSDDEEDLLGRSSWDPAAFDLDEVNQAIQLAVASPDEVLDLVTAFLHERGTLHPGLVDLLGRAPAAMVADLSAVIAAAPQEAADDVVVAAVRPFRVLLDHVAGGGATLTGAGWMKPTVVQALFDELGMASFWIGEGNREHMTEPVKLLRTTARQLGLVRTHNGRVLLTRAGNRARSDDGAIWQRLVERLVPDELGAARDATVLVLCEVVRSGSFDWSLLDGVAAGMADLGWRAEDGPLDRRHALDAAEPAWRVLQLIHDVVGVDSPAMADAAVVALAHDTLRT